MSLSFDKKLLRTFNNQFINTIIFIVELKVTTINKTNLRGDKFNNENVGVGRAITKK